jgi:hypothetical protein
MKRMYYCGPIKELQNETALVRAEPGLRGFKVRDPDKYVLVQFDRHIWVDGKDMGTEWRPVHIDHLSVTNPRI